MASDRRFQELIAELTTREASTLTIATVASSASLVLLGLGNKDGTYPPTTALGGFLFVVLGVLYRELTIFGIDMADLSDLDKERTGYSKSEFSREKPYVKTLGYVRRFLLRVLLILPGFMWVGSLSLWYLWEDLLTGSLAALLILPNLLEAYLKEHLHLTPGPITRHE